ncbi:MAG: hypothetical protein QF473_20430, partial [Planctomycetota bacterium]|nr:hypothetical protein [Planctomycetota bacterium]
MELAQAAWFLQPCSRAPVFLIVVVGSWIAVMATFNGYGRALAKSRLNESTAQVASLAPAPVDPSENAAMIWRKAQQMLIRFEEPKGFFPSLLRTWESPE